MRGLLAAILCWFALPAGIAAQEADAPILQMELEAESAIPGQPIILRVTVLTPTWFPDPPEFPSFEVPNVIVRLPQRGAGPTSQRIGGETWSGVTRAYRLYPMIAGRFRIPPRNGVVTYADPETREPLTAELPTEAIAFSGIVPAEAADLDPFIAADSLTLEQTIEGDTHGLDTGAAIIRTVSARIEGTPALFLPPLIASPEGGGLAAYPDEAVVSESEQRGVLSGERVERVTYLAEGGGRFQVPPVTLRWFNLSDDTIAVAEVPGFEVSVAAPLPAAAEPNLKLVLIWSVAGIVAAALLIAAAWALKPRLMERYRTHRAAYLASEAFAFSQAMTAMRHRDLGGTLAGIDLWRARLPLPDGPVSGQLTQSLARLGAAHYGPGAQAGNAEAWSQCLDSLRAARRDGLAAAASYRKERGLPALNP